MIEFTISFSLPELFIGLFKREYIEMISFSSKKSIKKKSKIWVKKMNFIRDLSLIKSGKNENFKKGIKIFIRFKFKSKLRIKSIIILKIKIIFIKRGEKKKIGMKKIINLLLIISEFIDSK